MNAVMDASLSRPLKRSDIKTLALAAVGGALEFYDFIIYVFFAAVIAKLFFPADMSDGLRLLQTYGIFAAGYLARPLGGIIMGHFGDRSGRKRMFSLSVFLMALPTLGIGLLPTYTTIGFWAPIALLSLRILQGAAIGGEIPGAWVFVAEHAPPKRVGLACGAVTSGITAGILLGSLIATAVNHYFLPDEIKRFAWRLPFLIGGAFGFLAMFLRRWLQETPVFEELRKRRTLAEELPLKRVIRDHLGAVGLSITLTWTLTAAIVVVILMTPNLLQKLFGFSAAQALSTDSAATLCLTIGCLLTGILLDRFGSGKVLMVGCALLLVSTYALYLGVGWDRGLLLPLFCFAGLTVGVVSVVPAVMVSIFPAPVRFSGLSFSYNLAYAIFGGMTPPLVAWLVQLNPLGPAHYVAAVSVLGIAMGFFINRRSTSQNR